MTYIEIKTVYGNQYKYLRRAVRIGEKVQHINLKYLEPVNPVYKIEQKRKSNASVYVHQLKDSEIKELIIATKSMDAFKRDRAKILLLSSQRYIPIEIAERIGCGVRKVRKAIKAFNENGLKALKRRKAKGAPPRFTKEQRAEILQTVSTAPENLGQHFTTWSLPRLKKYLIEAGIVKYICIESIRKILISQGSDYKKSKKRQYSNDPDFSKKNLLRTN